MRPSAIRAPTWGFGVVVTVPYAGIARIRFGGLADGLSAPRRGTPTDAPDIRAMVRACNRILPRAPLRAAEALRMIRGAKRRGQSDVGREDDRRDVRRLRRRDLHGIARKATLRHCTRRRCPRRHPRR